LLLHPDPGAGGAGLRHRAVPGGEVALRVAHAAPERLALLRAPLGEFPAVALGALHPDRERAGALALRVGGAGQELAEAPGLDHHRRAAEVARLVARPVGR